MPRLKPQRDLEGLRRRVLEPGALPAHTRTHEQDAGAPPRAIVPRISLVDALCGETFEKLMQASALFQYLDSICVRCYACIRHQA
jgi:hypothetical protein